MVDLVDSVERVHAIYLNQNRDVTKASAYNKVNNIFRELDDVKKSVVGELQGFESVNLESLGSLVALDTPEGEQALLKFRLCLLYHNLRMLASLPLLSFLVWQGLTKQRASLDHQVLSDLAEECVSSAETTVSGVSRACVTRLMWIMFGIDSGFQRLHGPGAVFAIRKSGLVTAGWKLSLTQNPADGRLYNYATLCDTHHLLGQLAI